MDEDLNDAHEADVEDDDDHQDPTMITHEPAPLHVLGALVTRANAIDAPSDGLASAEPGMASAPPNENDESQDEEDDGEGDDSDDGEHDQDQYYDDDADAYGDDRWENAPSEDHMDHPAFDHDPNTTDHSDHPFSPVAPLDHDSSDHADEKMPSVMVSPEHRGMSARGRRVPAGALRSTMGGARRPISDGAATAAAQQSADGAQGPPRGSLARAVPLPRPFVGATAVTRVSVQYVMYHVLWRLLKWLCLPAV